MWRKVQQALSKVSIVAAGRVIGGIVMGVLQALGVLPFLVAIVTGVVTYVWGIIAGLPEPIAFVLMLAAFALILVIAYYLKRFFAKQADSPPTVSAASEWSQELHDLRTDRRDFWQLLHGAYARSVGDHTNRSEAPLLNLIHDAKYPDLPRADGREFAKWVWDAPDEWSGCAQKLNDFAAGLYPATTPPVAVQSPWMSYSDHRRFDSLRMDLTKFWDMWGRQELLETVIRDQNMDGVIMSHAAEIKMLTFLEVARARWMPTGAAGKSGLFTLGRRNAEMES